MNTSSKSFSSRFATQFTSRMRFLSAAVLVSLFFSACTLLDSEDGHYSLKDEKLTRIDRAQALEFYDGHLIVANRGRGSGIAVIDTGTGKIVDFYAQDIPPYSIALDTAGHLFVGGTTFEKHELRWIDLTAKQVHISPLVAHNFSDFHSSSGQTYLLDTEFPGPWAVRRAEAVPGGGLELGAPLLFNSMYPREVLVASGKMFLSLSQGRALQVLDPLNLTAGASDTIDFSPPGLPLDPYETYALSMTAHDGHLFVAVSGRPADTSYHRDTSYVAVIDISTRNLVKTISLAYRHPGNGHVRNGRWYLSVGGDAWNPSNGNPVLDGGIEVIDLNAQAHAGIIATEQVLGGNVGGFLAVSDHAGYVIVRSGDESIAGRVKKVSF